MIFMKEFLYLHLTGALLDLKVLLLRFSISSGLSPHNAQILIFLVSNDRAKAIMNDKKNFNKLNVILMKI